MINLKRLKVFCLILGVISLIMAFVVFDGSVGYTESNEAYGGDAYTGIQNAAAQAANNIKYVGETVRDALGYFMLVQGLCLLGGSFCITKKPAAPVQPVEAPVQPAQPVTSDWFCGVCGKQNHAEYRFCAQCGKPKE